MLISLSLVAGVMARILLASSSTSGNSISVNIDWGYTSCANPIACTATSPTRTLTVPGTGTIRLDSSLSSCKYSKNGGAFTTFATGSTLTSLVTGDTLAFQRTLNNGVVVDITVTDSTTSALVGTCQLENIEAGADP